MGMRRFDMGKEKDIPETIMAAFSYMTKNFKGKVERLGVKDGIEWFLFRHFEALDVGFPSVVGIGPDGNLCEKFGHESLELIGSLVED